MTKDDILDKLESLNRDRTWLASVTSYAEDTVMNKLGPSGKISGRMMEAFERVILEEEARGRVDLNKEDLSIWDLVTFTGKETARIMDASKVGGYTKIEDLYRDAVIDFCDDLIAEENKTITLDVIEYDLHIPAYLSAGLGTDSDDSDEVIKVAKQYPRGYRGARVQGGSMDDGTSNAIPDGSIAIINTEWIGKPFPSKNKIYAWYTSEGNKLKKFVLRKVDGKTQGFLESLNPKYLTIPYERDMIAQGEFIEVCDRNPSDSSLSKDLGSQSYSDAFFEDKIIVDEFINQWSTSMNSSQFCASISSVDDYGKPEIGHLIHKLVDLWILSIRHELSYQSLENLTDRILRFRNIQHEEGNLLKDINISKESAKGTIHLELKLVRTKKFNLLLKEIKERVQITNAVRQSTDDLYSKIPDPTHLLKIKDRFEFFLEKNQYEDKSIEEISAKLFTGINLYIRKIGLLDLIITNFKENSLKRDNPVNFLINSLFIILFIREIKNLSADA